ncbi:hypothetical protein [Nonomuraea deserti]|nr:hypothetical protein [Nonomuraea deserti]
MTQLREVIRCEHDRVGDPVHVDIKAQPFATLPQRLTNEGFVEPTS